MDNIFEHVDEDDQGKHLLLELATNTLLLSEFACLNTEYLNLSLPL